MYSRRDLVNFLSNHGPEFHPTDERMAYAGRVCCMLEILQASRDGWGPELESVELARALKVTNILNHNFVGCDYSETFATAWADKLIARIRHEIGVRL